jgi:hypothetical protein
MFNAPLCKVVCSFAFLLAVGCGGNRFHIDNASDAGCGADPAKGAQLAPGQPCRDSSQCQQFCCECTDLGPSQNVALCQDGKCADKTTTCSYAENEKQICQAK